MSFTRIDGVVDDTRSAAALDRVVARHELLRSRVDPSGEAPRWCPGPPLTLERRSVSSVEALDWEVQAVIAAGVDLEVGPMGRVVRLDQGGDRWLLVVLHHAVVDGASFRVLMNDLTASYRGEVLPELPYPVPGPRGLAAADGRSSGGPGPPAAWQRRLADAQRVALPADRPRDRADCGRVTTNVFRIDGPAAIEAVARRLQTTPFAVAMAAWFSALWSWTGQTHLAVATPIYARTTTAAEQLVGLMVDTVVLGCRGRSRGLFEVLVHQLHLQLLEAWTAVDVPFTEVAAGCRAPRQLGEPVLAASLVSLHTEGRPTLALDGARLVPVPPPGAAAVYDLTLDFTPDGDGWVGELQANRSMFDSGDRGGCRGPAPARAEAPRRSARRPVVRRRAPPARPPPTRRPAPGGWPGRPSRPADRDRGAGRGARRRSRRSSAHPEDDFFALGGHSLTAVHLASRLTDWLAVPIPVRWVYEWPVLADLARRLETAGGTD